jgi:hypothetical protein
MAQRVPDIISNNFDEVTKRICWLRGITELLRGHDPECETSNLGWLLDGIVDGIEEASNKIWEAIRQEHHMNN